MATTVVLGISGGAARAQSEFQSWTLLAATKKYSPQWLGYIEAQPRLQDDGDLEVLLLRTAAGYAVRPNVTLWLGYASVYGYRGRNTLEYRPFQQLQTVSKLPALDLINRTRLEERYVEGTIDPSIRLRHLVRGFFPLDPKRKWALVAQDELFVNLNSATPRLRSGFDQNRAFAGASAAVGRGTRLDFGYQRTDVRVPGAGQDRVLHTLFTALNVSL